MADTRARANRSVWFNWRRASTDLRTLFTEYGLMWVTLQLTSIPRNRFAVDLNRFSKIITQKPTISLYAKRQVSSYQRWDLLAIVQCPRLAHLNELALAIDCWPDQKAQARLYAIHLLLSGSYSWFVSQARKGGLLGSSKPWLFSLIRSKIESCKTILV